MFQYESNIFVSTSSPKSNEKDRLANEVFSLRCGAEVPSAEQGPAALITAGARRDEGLDHGRNRITYRSVILVLIRRQGEVCHLLLIVHIRHLSRYPSVPLLRSYCIPRSLPTSSTFSLLCPFQWKGPPPPAPTAPHKPGRPRLRPPARPPARKVLRVGWAGRGASGRCF